MVFVILTVNADCVKECKFLDKDRPYTFCGALFTKDMCLRKENDNRETVE